MKSKADCLVENLLDDEAEDPKDYATQQGLSGDATFSPEAELALWLELVGGPDEDYPFDSTELKRLLSLLDERMLCALWSRYEKRETLAAVGMRLRSTKSPDRVLDKQGVSTLIGKALRRMRHYIRAKPR